MKNYRIVPGMWFLLLGVCCIMSGCLKKEEIVQDKQAQTDNATIQQYLLAKNEQATPQMLGSNTYYSRVLKANPTGQATKSLDIIAIYYSISVLNGKVIDSVTTGEPMKFQLLTQTGALTPVGLDKGISLMRKGEKFRFYIPSGLAYGTYTYSADFPENSNIVVDVEVVDILTNTQQIVIENQLIKKYIADNKLVNVDSLNSGIHYQKTVDGTGSTPAAGQTVTVSYVGKYLDGTIFDQSGTNNYSFPINTTNLIKGFRDGIAQMKKGEKGKIIIPSNLAYGSGFQIIPKFLRPDLITKDYLKDIIAPAIPPFSTLVFDVELIDIK
ncbi:MAG: FKBP-type peptidyl-prolyl cis-trans isomerase [Bacteroidota bacterium]